MFYNYFVELCNRAKISPSKAAQQIGLSKSSVSAWKNGSVPRDSQIVRIANFFEIPASDIYDVVNSQKLSISNRTEFEKFLMNRAEKSPASNKETEDFAKYFAMLTPEHQQQIRSAMAELIKEQLQG